MFERAIARKPGANFSEGLTSADLGSPSLPRALEEHAAYCEALRRCGLAVTELEADSRFPDATFVEDTAVIVSTHAILTRPGARSRAGEVEAMRQPLAQFFGQLDEIAAPGTLDGGDVCEAENHYYIGISKRTNPEGAGQLATYLRKHGRTSSFVDIRDMTAILHLKSGLTYLGDGNFLAIEELEPKLYLRTGNRIRVPAGEEYGANCIRVNFYVLLASGHPQLETLLDLHGYRPLVLDMSEYEKMDGGLSCLSLRF